MVGEFFTRPECRLQCSVPEPVILALGAGDGVGGGGAVLAPLSVMAIRSSAKSEEKFGNGDT
jgi:hypothetical protein